MRLIVTDLRTLRQDTPSVREMEFHDASVDVGSHSNSMVQLPDVEVAAHHATIAKTGDGEWVFRPAIRDDQTFLNDKPITEEVELSDGDTIRITHFEIQCRLEVEDDSGGLSASSKPREFGKIRQYPLPPRSLVRRIDSEVSLAAPRQTALADLLAALRTCRDVGALIESAAGMLHAQLEARLVWLGIRAKPSGPLETVYGHSIRGDAVSEPPLLETFSYRCLERQQCICVPKAETPGVQSILAVPLMIGKDTVGLIYADSRRHVRLFDEADLDFLTIVASGIASFLGAFAANGTRGSVEVGGAAPAHIRDAQVRLIEPELPNWPGLDLVRFTRAGTVGGDFHDAMSLPNGLAAIVVANVAAEIGWIVLTLAQLRSAFRLAGLHADPPHVQLKALNWLFQGDSLPGSAHVAIVVLNPQTGVFECATAGAIGALVIGSDGQPRKLTDSTALPLGTRKQSEYKSVKDRLAGKEILALYTSGCATIRGAKGKELGSRKFLKALCSCGGQPANYVLQEVQAELQPYLEEGQVPNDMTIVLGRRNDEP